jgi:hypothetical protein
MEKRMSNAQPKPFVSGMVFPIPTIGAIRIGEAVERNGKRLPNKTDYFTITSLAKKQGKWVDHPVIRKLQPDDESATQTDGQHEDIEGQRPKKLRAIPVRMLTDSPDLILRARYEAMHRTQGNIACAGDGETAKRRKPDGSIEEVECRGPEHCPFAKVAEHPCRFFGRLNVQIEGQDDTSSTFILRTSSVNTLRTLYSKLWAFHARYGGLLRGIPFMLRLRGKSTPKSFGSIFYFVDLTLADGVTDIDAIKAARELASLEAEVGLNQAAFEQSLREGLAAGAFEDTPEDMLQNEDFLLEDGIDGAAGEVDQEEQANLLMDLQRGRERFNQLVEQQHKPKAEEAHHPATRQANTSAASEVAAPLHEDAPDMFDFA